MYQHVIEVFGLKRDEKKGLGFKDSDEIEICEGPFSTAFGPIPKGVSFQEIMEANGWEHAGNGIYTKTVEGKQYKARNIRLPDVVPLDFLP